MDPDAGPRAGPGGRTERANCWREDPTINASRIRERLLGIIPASVARGPRPPRMFQRTARCALYGTFRAEVDLMVVVSPPSPFVDGVPVPWSREGLEDPFPWFAFMVRERPIAYD